MCVCVADGDLSPGTDGMRVFTLFMIFMGVIVVFSRLAYLLSAATGQVTASGRAWLERLFPQIKVRMTLQWFLV